LPLANLPEGSGDFIRSLPMAVMVTVLASLFVSLTIIPFLSSRLLGAHEKDSHGQGNFFFNVFRKYINTPYQNLLSWCMKHPISTLIVAAVLFLLSFLIVPLLGFSLFPASEKPIITLDVDIEPGSSLDHTDVVMRKLERELMHYPQIKRLATNSGKGNPRIYYNEFQKQNSSNSGQFVAFMEDDAKVPEIEAFADTLRQKYTNFAGAKIEVKRFQQGPPISAPIEFRILGTNLDSLKQLSGRVEQLMKNAMLYAMKAQTYSYV
jgi:multidrug efflux pump subunit AcrB